MISQVELAPEIEQELSDFVATAQGAFGADLISAVLFGSAAEARLRSVSDVNLLLLLKRYRQQSVDQIRDAFRAAHAAMRLDVMFLLESEIEPAMDAFAVKFSDILVRRRVLFGPDPFASLTIPPVLLRQRITQTLLNIMLRMRERYALVSLREEQLALVAAEAAAPLRVCAASILSLEGGAAKSPREALAAMLAEPGCPGEDRLSEFIDMARRKEPLPPGTAGALVFALIGVAGFMYRRVSGPVDRGGRQVNHD